MSSNKKNALGRGLSALLENSNTDITSTMTEGNPTVVGAIANIALAQIEANPFQPRNHFEKEALLELSESIKEHGIIQPITVRKLGYDKFQLISGERRFKASTIAGLTHIPAYIRIANDQTMLELALVENIQRENLDAVEIAISYKRLIDECSLTQESLSKKVSKQRSTITNYLRLLKLPAEIQIGIRDKKISMGHARALVNIEEDKKQLHIYQLIIANDLSVRQVEELARAEKPQPVSTIKPKDKKDSTPLSFEHQKITKDLTAHFSSKVDFKMDNKGKGKIVIEFNSSDDLKRIIDVLDI